MKKILRAILPAAFTTHIQPLEKIITDEAF